MNRTDEIVYYTIKLRLFHKAPLPMFIQEAKNEMYLSANGRLSGNKEARLDSHDLAQQFLTAYMPRLQKRYGNDFETDIVKVTTRSQIGRMKRLIEQDSVLARKRIETGVLAPNQNPI